MRGWLSFQYKVAASEDSVGLTKEVVSTVVTQRASSRAVANLASQLRRRADRTSNHARPARSTAPSSTHGHHVVLEPVDSAAGADVTAVVEAGAADCVGADAVAADVDVTSGDRLGSRFSDCVGPVDVGLLSVGLGKLGRVTDPVGRGRGDEPPPQPVTSAHAAAVIASAA